LNSRRRAIVCLIGAGAFAACGKPDSTSPAVPEQAMVLVPGATFTMGRSEADLESVARVVGLASTRALQSEIGAHDVTVADFYIDRYDVTNRRFAEFVVANPEWGKAAIAALEGSERYLEHWEGDEPPGDRLDHPVTFITWHAAVAYCDWRDKRLPTEAEYEWAAGDGTSAAEFPWGDALPNDSVVNWGDNGIDTTVPVGSYPPNARGLYDMAGNIWHFTADPWLGSYEEAEDYDDPVSANEDPDIRRVVRGGSFGANAANLRVRYRDSHRPRDAREMVGFRCARTADPVG
jgi:formylglycine-generating enzyme required for sulfatase activity